MQYSTTLYAGLPAETQVQTGWGRPCERLSVARTDQPMAMRCRAIASAQGVAVKAPSPVAAQAKVPAIQVADLKGAIWLPGDGRADPADLTQPLANALPRARGWAARG
jgi:4-methylaminobutanoate oxidase (formaldehyde-forming)